MPDNEQAAAQEAQDGKELRLCVTVGLLQTQSRK
jgi:hypothetical protein